MTAISFRTLAVQLSLGLTFLSACSTAEPVKEEPPVDLDADGVAEEDDCDDVNADVYPNAPEFCDGKDNDCDGLIDEEADDALTWYADTDADGYGQADLTAVACEAPENHVGNADDCDDENEWVHPEALETCDEIDNDCDGFVDDADPNLSDATEWYLDHDDDSYGDAAFALTTCTQPDNYVADSTDCNDLSAAVYPGGIEICDGLDNDCDQLVDDEDSFVLADSQSLWFTDGDGDGHGAEMSGYLACTPGANAVETGLDCDDSNAAIHPDADEVCDTVDNNCDGVVDTDAIDIQPFYADSDTDGYGDANAPTLACIQPAGHVTDNTDCQDADATVNPGAAEICDTADNNCDGLVDILDPNVTDATTWYLDYDNDTYGDAGFTLIACDQPANYVINDTDCNDTDSSAYPGATELCDGIDNNCDQSVDEDTAQDATSWFMDTDLDGYGDPSTEVVSCIGPVGYIDNGDDCDDGDSGSTLIANDADCDGTETSLDCDDTDDQISPDIPEICEDGIDNDCNGVDDSCNCDINEPGTLLNPNSGYCDPNPPATWTQCAGWTNTTGDDVANDVLDACLNTNNRLRIRVWYNGVLEEDVYSTDADMSSWQNWDYHGGSVIRDTYTYWIGTTEFFSSPTGVDACLQQSGSSGLVLGTGMSGTVILAPGNSDGLEYRINCSGNALIGRNIAVYH